MRLALVVLCLLVSAFSQDELKYAKKRRTAVAGGGGSFSLTRVGGRGTYAVNMTCATTTCTLTIPSTTSGHAGALFAMDSAGSGITLSSVTGGCTWTVQANAHLSSGPVGDINAATCTGMSAGTTSLSIVFSSTVATADAQVYFFDVAWSGSSISVETVPAATNGGAGATGTGPALTFTGSAGAALQFCADSGGQPTAYASPYATNFTNKDTQGTPANMGFIGSSYVVNTTTGTAATCNLVTSDFYLMSAIGFKGI